YTPGPSGSCGPNVRFAVPPAAAASNEPAKLVPVGVELLASSMSAANNLISAFTPPPEPAGQVVAPSVGPTHSATMNNCVPPGWMTGTVVTALEQGKLNWQLTSTSAAEYSFFG